MFSRTLSQVLTDVEEFHRNLASHYTKLLPRAETEDVRVFLGLLRQNEEHYAHSISRYRDRAAGDVLDTWVQFPPEVQLQHSWNESDFDPSMTVRAVSRLAVGYDHRLKKHLLALSDGTAPARLHDALQGLVDLESTKDVAIHDATRMN